MTSPFPHLAKLSLTILLALACWSVWAAGPVYAQDPIYVDKEATSGANDGSSWNDAYLDLQTGLGAATSGDEIWVASGVYTPGLTQSDTFTLTTGIAVYGGFAGTETARSQRDWMTNVTVLSGDIDGNDTTDSNGIITNTANITGSNSYHVVVGSDTDSTAVLDGFTITGGSANNNAIFGGDSGGGMYNNSGSPTLVNLTFYGNQVLSHGGGMYNRSSSPSLSNVGFINNRADSTIDAVGGGITILDPNVSGGGMTNHSSSAPTLNSVIFSGNSSSEDGGALHNDSSTVALTDVIFTGNVAQSRGGAIYTYNSSSILDRVIFLANIAQNDGGGFYISGGSSSPTLTNVIFRGNYALSDGGGLVNGSNSSPQLTHVTFSGNRAGTGEGGAIYNRFGSNSSIENSIIWNNADSSGTDTISATIYHSSNSTATITNTLIAASNGSGGSWSTSLGIDGGGNLDADPLFETAVDPTTAPTTAGNLALQNGSPAQDAANSAACPSQDILGVSRPQGTGCDMGAYERLLAAFLTINTQTDGDDANPGDGVCDSDLATNGYQCTLRAAISESNALPGTQTFDVPAGIYTLTLAGATEDNNATGDLDITADISLIGAGTGNTIVQAGSSAATGVDRVFHLLTGTTSITLQGMSIRYGYIPSGLSAGDDRGGGILHEYSSTLTLSDTLITENIVADTGDDGGGIANVAGGTINIWDSTISDNQVTTAFGSGGGLFNVYGGQVSINNSVISGNQVEGKGGGIYNHHNSATVTVENSLIQNNLAKNEGGGIQNASIMTMTNTTISGNSSWKDGGGVSLLDETVATLYAYHVTIAANTADLNNDSGGLEAGGGLYRDMGTATLVNTLIADNKLGSNTADDCKADSDVTATNSLVGVSAGCTLSGSNNLLGVEPVLATLGSYGGDTQTHAFLPGSPAIDAADSSQCEALDQRGVTRPVACDIGAFESQGFTLTISGGDTQTSQPNTAFADSLQVTVSSTAGEPVGPGGVINFTAPSSGASVTTSTLTATTDSSGLASVAVTANEQEGSYQVTAQANGISSGVNFTLTNGTVTKYYMPVLVKEN